MFNSIKFIGFRSFSSVVLKILKELHVLSQSEPNLVYSICKVREKKS